MASDGFHYKTKGTLCSVQTSVYPAAAVKVVTGTLAGASGSCMVLFFSYWSVAFLCQLRHLRDKVTAESFCELIVELCSGVFLLSNFTSLLVRHFMYFS